MSKGSRSRTRTASAKADLPAWERLLSAQAVFNERYPECVLVGGTAAALHAGHRVSLDADYVMRDLRERYGEVLAQVEREAGWKTSRIAPPVMILGHFQGVRTGIRQFIRTEPLETIRVRGLRVPTEEEILRIKAYLIVRRNTTRDYVDFVALFDLLGTEKALSALNPLDRLYPQASGASVLQQLAVQLGEPLPWDLTKTDLSRYKALKPPYTDWNEVRRRAFAAAQAILRNVIVS
jgi:hypothetical protein